jgi:hypothetical protein
VDWSVHGALRRASEKPREVEARPAPGEGANRLSQAPGSMIAVGLSGPVTVTRPPAPSLTPNERNGLAGWETCENSTVLSFQISACLKIF